MFRLPARFTYILLYAALFATSVRAGVDYAEVSPIFARHCVICHSGPMAPMGLRMDSLDSIRKGSDRGAIVEAGLAANSELVKRIKGDSLPRMPMTGPPFLSDDEIAAIEGWINDGLLATDPLTSVEADTPGKPLKSVEEVTYAQVAPIFATRCAKCHSENGLMGSPPEGFVLTSYQSTLNAFDRVRVVPGDPEASELVRRIRGQARPRMPLDGPPYLQEAEIDLIVKWIADGAHSTDGTPGSKMAGSRVRLHGTLTAPDRLDGLKLVIGAHTRIDKNPAVGSYVEVRGRIDSAGRILVERLRRR